MTTRRSFLGGLARSASVLAAFRAGAIGSVLAAARSVAGRPAEDVAADEDYWREIQLAFTVDRSLINLNNGGVSPSPRIVQEVGATVTMVGLVAAQVGVAVVPSIMARAQFGGVVYRTLTPALWIATSVPVPIAMPTSAAARAGASLTPSPAIATTRPSARSFVTTACLRSGGGK